MMSVWKILLSILIISVIGGCSGGSGPVVEVKSFPITDLQGVITRSNVSFDPAVSADGNGSILVKTDQPVTVRLFEVHDIDIEDAKLIYQAMVRCEELDGRAYLEMLCHFDGFGEAFSRGLQSPISGTTEWTTEETPFFLRRGQNPNYVKLNLVIEGSGSAWIDDIKLFKCPLS
jgi:hypothetical protein